MVIDFQGVYPDEIFYGNITRYHDMSCNLYFQQSLKDLFGLSKVVTINDMPCHLENLSNNIPNELGYNSDFFIANCTLFPFYSPFINIKNKNECIKNMKMNNSIGLKHRLGIVAGSICKKQNIYFCPECVKSDTESYDDTYIHRIHQTPGFLVCDKHNCILKIYKEKPLSKVNYLSIELGNSVKYIDCLTKISSELKNKLMKISNEIRFLYENYNNSKLNCTFLYKKYYEFLNEQGYLTVKGNVRLKDLRRDLYNYY